MKKIFAVFALFMALIFVVSCGGSEDSGQTVGGRMWSSMSSSTYNWSDAVSYCDNLNEGGYSDWRLPTISELKTTIQNCQSGGSLCRVSDSCLSSDCWSKSCYCEARINNGGYYSKLGDPDGVCLWSSSTHSDSTDYAWYVNFYYGNVNFSDKTCSNFVRCVR